MKKNKDPNQIAQKWVDRLSAATTQMQQGVMAVKTAPGVLAAARKQAYVDGVNREQDKWASNVAGVSLSAWQQAYIKKGIPVIATRAAGAKQQFASFMAEWLNFQDLVANRLESLPRGTLEQNIARAVMVIRESKNFSENYNRGRNRNP